MSPIVVVAATNRPLEAMVEAGSFRSDLYFRLNVFPIELPPLSERPSDVAPLARHLVERLAERHGVATPSLTTGALELLAGQEWPGNVRQLANVLERAVILAEEPRIARRDLEALVEGSETVEESETGAGKSAGGEVGDRETEGGEPSERERLRRALVEADGDKRRAAELLGVSYRTLQRKVRHHDLEGVPHYRRGR